MAAVAVVAVGWDAADEDSSPKPLSLEAFPFVLVVPAANVVMASSEVREDESVSCEPEITSKRDPQRRADLRAVARGMIAMRGLDDGRCEGVGDQIESLYPKNLKCNFKTSHEDPDLALNSGLSRPFLEYLQ